MSWWRNAVLYGIDVRAFCDADGDGTGDLDGVRDRLGYLDLLGVDALCLGPVPQPWPVPTWDALLDDARDAGLRVLVDVDPGHTGTGHDWFLDAVSAPAGSAERERFHFRPGRGPAGDEPPTDWHALDGGPAWTHVPAHGGTGDPGAGEWYLHLPGPGRPDLNWANPEVWAETDRTLHAWIERGVDGVRIDLPHALHGPEDWADDPRPSARGPLAGPDDPRLDHDVGHEMLRTVRAELDHHPDRIAVARVDVADPARFARYGAAGELHLAVRTDLAHCRFDATTIRALVDHSLVAVRAAGAVPAWTCADPAGPRTAERLGGAARALALTTALLALPGAVLLDAGDELGLTGPAPARPGDARPLLSWDTAAAQLEDRESPLSLYRRALELRREHPGFVTCAGQHDVEWFGAPPGCLAFRRGGSTLVCALNTSAEPVPLPPGDVLFASGPTPGGRLPPDTTVWLV
ncbi:alpha-glucosidase [Pseudonocardia sediminis]|uniref:Alpha-glucosidase n=1 Tax=Pseudonocardia sediminis TaxID=1397368 RepID=A0A4Q7UUD2_PSEST|nr:alpha-amylase family glycosyl hydrolase [Pseudonocardia sediminis]RZT84624.1 alpha-glucosidase [Pseudonocardia sediminis]